MTFEARTENLFDISRNFNRAALREVRIKNPPGIFPPACLSRLPCSRIRFLIFLLPSQHIYYYTTFTFVLALHKELLIDSVYISLMNAILTS